MFLNDLCKTSHDLGDAASAEDYSAALRGVLSVVSHTNTMIWVGNMQTCPLSLCGQGQLLKTRESFIKEDPGKFQGQKEVALLPLTLPANCYTLQNCGSDGEIRES
eukprot:TRINITY_DN17310_c0_g1_i1.p1 TRINITY_DN17310_c0_g1~~TRINITY_DN17310_c0_g1_i1.p1  ORF type:complete len:106 (+),score=25.52 TRINITY_DN17310_c0_g1_i1:251-568(+)